MLQILNVSQIEQSRDTQARVELDNDIVDQYAAAMVAGAKFPPITVVFDSIKYYIADGWHRFFAYYRCHLTNIECEVINGTLRDATLIALGANAEHGLRRSNADKRKAVMIMLKDPVWSIWSNVKIAETCKVSETLVFTMRREMENDTSFKRGMNTDTSNIRSMNQAQENEATPETRTFVHPKTGKETQMNISNMKRKEPEPDEEEEIEEVEEEEVEEEEEWIDEEEVKEEFGRFKVDVLDYIESWECLNGIDDNPKIIKISNQIKQLFMLEETE